MASLTQYFGLQKLNANDPFSTNGQKYTTTDRDAIDRLLYLGAEGHHHTGAGPAASSPTSPGTLAQDTNGGTLSANTTYYYAYTLVDPNGFETAPSPTASITTPAQIAAPNPPTLTATPGTGTLPAGNYFYAVTAYTNTTSSETTGSTPAFVQLTSAGEITLQMPSLPTGASGFNIYRMDPNGANYLFVTSITSASWTDNGSVAENCNKYLPTSNTTNAVNEVTFTLPSQPPSGWTWNLYRTTDTTNWTNSLLTNLPYGTGFFKDTGSATTTGTPPTNSQLVGSPSKVLLTSGAEVQGTLPSTMVDLTGVIFPYAVTFAFPGTLVPTTGTNVWTCPFTSATILYAQCSLGRGSTPAAQNVIADVLLGTGATPTYTSIYSGASPNPKPQVPVGQQIGSLAAPNTTSIASGDSLSVDIDQTGGGATPTDSDLTVTIWLLVTDH